MSIRITTDTLEQAYELLKFTEPFKRWKLPHLDEVVFSVFGGRNRGEFYVENGTPVIGVSDKCHHTLEEMLKTLAHEMCHLREHQLGVRRDVQHGKLFNEYADKVCKAHQWDRGAF